MPARSNQRVLPSFRVWAYLGFSGTLAFPQREMLRSGRRVALPHPGPRTKRVFGYLCRLREPCPLHASKSLEIPANPDALGHVVINASERKELCAGDAEEGLPRSEDGTAARRNGETSAAGPADESEPPLKKERRRFG